jgi:hypothetical protein
MSTRRALLLGLSLVVMLSRPAPAQVVLETRSLRLEIRSDGVLKSLKAKPDGTEYLWAAEPGPVASVYRGGQMAVDSQEAFVEDAAPLYRGGEAFAASSVSLRGDRLTLQFGKANVTATYRVTTGQDYLAFHLLSLKGEPIDRIDLVQLRVRRLPHLGPWIDVAYDDAFGICLCAGNIKTNAGMNQFPHYVEMRAIATKEVALEGAAAVLFGCPDPKDKFLDAMERSWSAISRCRPAPATGGHPCRSAPISGAARLPATSISTSSWPSGPGSARSFSPTRRLLEVRAISSGARGFPAEWPI